MYVDILHTQTSHNIEEQRDRLAMIFERFPCIFSSLSVATDRSCVRFKDSLEVTDNQVVLDIITREFDVACITSHYVACLLSHASRYFDEYGVGRPCVS